METYLNLLAYVCAKVNGLAVISPTEGRGNGDVSELGPCGGTFFANRNFNVFHNVSNINHDIVKFEHVYSLLESNFGGSYTAGEVEDGRYGVCIGSIGSAIFECAGFQTVRSVNAPRIEFTCFESEVAVFGLA